MSPFKTTLLTVTAGVALATAVTGCGTTTIDAAKAETKIKEAVTNQVGAKVKTVTCPKGKSARRGDVFTCSVVGADGSKGLAVLTQQDDKGNLKIRAPFLHVREIENIISVKMSREQGNADVTLACPDIVVAKAGSDFGCQATEGTTTKTVSVMQQDADGNIRYRLASTAGG